MKKTIGIVLVLCLFMSSLALAVDIKSFVVYASGSDLSYKAVVVSDNLDGSGVEKIDMYCKHNNLIMFKSGELYKLSNSAKGYTQTSYQYMKNSKCVKGDVAWLQIGDFKSKEVIITRKTHHKAPVIEITPEQKKLNECNANALTWFDKSKKDKWAKALYELNLKACQYQYDESICEKDSTKVFAFGKCVDKHKARV
jgi:hypothetical protein